MNLPTEKLYSLGRHKMFKRWKCSSFYYVETLAKYQLSAAWWNELVLRSHDNFCSSVQYLQSKIKKDDSTFRSHMATCLATVTDGYVALILSWQLKTRRQLTPATKDKFGVVGWLAKSPTDSKMHSLLVTSFCLHWKTNLSRTAIFRKKLYILYWWMWCWQRFVVSNCL